MKGSRNLEIRLLCWYNDMLKYLTFVSIGDLPVDIRSHRWESKT